MFGLFKKKIEKEYWNKMKQCEASYNFLQQTSFSSAPDKWGQHLTRLTENNQWISSNIDELKQYLTSDQIKMTQDAVSHTDDIIKNLKDGKF